MKRFDKWETMKQEQLLSKLYTLLHKINNIPVLDMGSKFYIHMHIGLFGEGNLDLKEL